MQRRIGRRRKYVVLARHPQNVGCVTATRALAVIGVNGTAFEGRDGVLDVSGLVECVRVNGDLNVHFVCHPQRLTNCGRCRAPVLVDLQTGRTGLICSTSD